MKIKKDDNVIVVAGKDKGKTGKVLRAFPRLGKVIIMGVNVKKIHKKPRKQSDKGEIIDQAAPIDVSNVALIDPKTKKPTRVSFSIEGDKKVRVTKDGTVLS